MGARWAWDAVCPNLHVYGNFSGGADPCYECGEEPEVIFETENSRQDADEYAARRRTGKSAESIEAEGEIALLRNLAEKHGFKVIHA